MLVTVLSSVNTGHENWDSVIASVPAVLAPPGTLAAPWLPALSALSAPSPHSSSLLGSSAPVCSDNV